MKPIDLTEGWNNGNNKDKIPAGINPNPKSIQEIYEGLVTTYSDDRVLSNREKLMLKSAVVGGVILLIENLKAGDEAAITKIKEEVNKFMSITEIEDLEL